MIGKAISGEMTDNGQGHVSHPVPGMTRLGVESRASPSRVGASLDR